MTEYQALTELPSPPSSRPGLPAKEQAELAYWSALSDRLSAACTSRDERRRALLQVCWDKTFPRYKESLYLDDASFLGRRVLDLACGPHGGLIGFEGCERYGTDHLLWQYRALGYPLEQHGIRYVQCKSEKLAFPDAFFDCLLCVNALDHVDDLAATFGEIGRVLARGGRFLAQVNFHPLGTATEPHCLTHPLLLQHASQHGLGVRQVLYQGYVEAAAEHRYYYALEKDFPRFS